MTVCNLADCRPRHIDAIGELGNAFIGALEVVEELHSLNVPHTGTYYKRFLCPTGVLGDRARGGHSDGMLPNNIATYRKRNRLSQEQLAEAIGTTRNMMVKLENGKRGLTSDWLEKIGDRLGVPPYLLIAPEQLLPTEEQLADMLSAAQQTLPAGLPYSEWPRAVASGLHTRLRTLSGDLANAADADDQA